MRGRSQRLALRIAYMVQPSDHIRPVGGGFDADRLCARLRAHAASPVVIARFELCTRTAEFAAISYAALRCGGLICSSVTDCTAGGGSGMLSCSSSNFFWMASFWSGDLPRMEDLSRFNSASMGVTLAFHAASSSGVAREMSFGCAAAK